MRWHEPGLIGAGSEPDGPPIYSPRLTRRSLEAEPSRSLRHRVSGAAAPTRPPSHDQSTRFPRRDPAWAPPGRGGFIITSPPPRPARAYKRTPLLSSSPSPRVNCDLSTTTTTTTLQAERSTRPLSDEEGLLGWCGGSRIWRFLVAALFGRGED
uniref:Uncharacterized protein n=1 Tax=Oryza meridionalis TaxID=40149 RepID=A0A0E0EEM9_9ORYZ